MQLVEVSIKSHIPFRLIHNAYAVVIVVSGSEVLCKVSQSMENLNLGSNQILIWEGQKDTLSGSSI